MTLINNKYYKNKDRKSPKRIIKGRVYGQEINGTIIKQKIIKYLGIFNHHRHYLVENIETGFRCTLSQDSLHVIDIKNTKNYFEKNTISS